VSALSGNDDLRVDRASADDLRKDPALIDTLMRSRGFFPGRRTVVIEAARDGIAKTLSEALSGITSEDAFLVVTAEVLTARSSLRRLFERDARLASIALYPDPPGQRELEALLHRAGLSDRIAAEALANLEGVVAELDHGQLMQLIEKIKLFSLNVESKLDSQDILALSPSTNETEMGTLVDCVADGRAGDVSRLIGQLASGAANPVQMLLFTGRRFRQLLMLACAEDGTNQALRRLRPPVYGAKAHMLARQSSSWGRDRLETALRIIHGADRTLRAAGKKPGLAIVERALIRVAMLSARR